jgi:hypothetical protein
MKIYFDDPEYDGQFLRTLDHAPLGAQLGEAWAVATEITTQPHRGNILRYFRRTRSPT